MSENSLYWASAELDRLDMSAARAFIAENGGTVRMPSDDIKETLWDYDANLWFVTLYGLSAHGTSLEHALRRWKDTAQTRIRNGDSSPLPCPRRECPFHASKTKGAA